MVAATSSSAAIGVACALLAYVPSSWADAPDRLILGADPAWQWDDVELRTMVLDQRGHGYQAQGAPIGVPGSEQMWLVEPWARVTLRQDAHISHDISMPVDAISAASPDAVDAQTSASRRNVSTDLDVRSTFQRDADNAWITRVAVHHEEPLSSVTLGGGWRRSFADDNATFALTGAATGDAFDHHDHYGTYLGKTARGTFNVNVALTQLLSPTTVIDGSYGITAQVGQMDIGWNAVPTSLDTLVDESLPRERVRHAASLRLAQHVPPTHSTLKAWYRAYLDDWGLRAHTVELDAYQYVVPWLYVRGGFRFHHQTGVSFFTTDASPGMAASGPRTADSDLAPLDATEWSLELVTVRRRGPLRPWSFSAELMRYTRTNDLQITTVALSVGRALSP